jgi:hypothetical protein
VLSLGIKNDSCKSCVSFIGFRILIVGIIGCILGFIATRVVDTPPSLILIAESKKQTENMTDILLQLSRIEKNIIVIKEKVSDVKEKLDAKTP